jgi:hypothetical protein
VALATALSGPLSGLAAAAEPDLLLIAQVTPEKPFRGETVKLDVQALQGISYVALDNYTARVFYFNGTRENLTLTPNGTGRYAVSVTIPVEVVRMDGVNIIVEGWRNGKHGSVQVYVTPADMPHFVNPGLMLFGSLVSQGPLPYRFAPGDRLSYRVWTYVNGSLQDVAPPVGRAYLRPHGLPNGASLTPLRTNTTRLGVGAYELVADLPGDIHVTTGGYISAEVPNMTMAYGAAYAFNVDPFPAAAAFDTRAGETELLRVCAGRGLGPLPNASVSADFAYSTGSASNRRFQTGQDGCGRVALEWPSNETDRVDADVVVQVGAEVVYISLTYRRHQDRLYNILAFGLSDDFRIELLGEPADTAPGATANISFRVTHGGTPFASAEIGVVETWWRGDRTEVPVYIANVSTDASGFLNVSFEVPASWESGLDFLWVRLYTPAGDEASYAFGFGPYEGYGQWPPADPTLTVSAQEDAKNGMLQVHAAYAGGLNLSGWRAYAKVYPVGTNRDDAVGGAFPWAEILLNGTAGDANITLPPWIWEGDFEVMVVMYTFGRAVQYNASMIFQNSTLIHLHGRPAVTPPPPGPPAPPAPVQNSAQLLADLNLALLFLMAILAAAAAAVFVVSRRRNSTNDPEEDP